MRPAKLSIGAMRAAALSVLLATNLLAAACSDGGGTGDCDREGGCDPDAGSPDGGAADAGIALAPCGSTDLLVEDFETSDPEQLRWIPFNFGPGLPPVIEDGKAILSFDDAGGTGAPGFRSARAYRFDESQVAVDAAGVVDLPDVETRLYMTYPSDSQVGFRVLGGQLQPHARVMGGELQVLESVLFSPDDHRHWRLREAGDQIHFETSPDGAVWTELATTSSRPFAHPGDLLFVLVESSTQSGEISIEGVNQVGELAATGWCPIDRLADDFDDPAVADVWQITTAGGCTANELNGVLQLSNPTAGGACGYHTPLGQILRDSAVWVEAAMPGAGAPDLVFAVQLGVGGDRLLFQHRDGNRLQIQRIEPGELPGDAGAEIFEDLAFDTTEHRYWRFRHQDGALHFDTAPDGATWTSRRQLADPLAVDDVFVRLETTRSGASAVAFDDLSQPPP